MEIIKTEFDGLFEIIPRVFHDDRGYFLETWNAEKFKNAGIPHEYVQDNQSFSVKGVLRGLHFQKAPYEQGKLVRVSKGKALDVVVDTRKDSSTYGKWTSFLLEADRSNMVYVPAGFAHGFVALEDCIFCYKVTAPYNKESESGILWNDPKLNIDWQIEKPLISEKDLELPLF